MSPRKPRSPRPSRLSMTTRLKQLEQENLDFREGLETIADVLEDLGILDPPEDEDDPEVEPDFTVEIDGNPVEDQGILNQQDAEDAEKDKGGKND